MDEIGRVRRSHASRVRRARALVLLILFAPVGGLPGALGEDNGVHAIATFDPPLPTTGWTRGDVRVSLACSSNAANCVITYRLDQGPSVAYNAPILVSSDGDHWLNTTTSPNGNAGLTSDSFRVRIDRTAPMIADHADVIAPRAGESTSVTFENPSATDALSGLTSLGCAPASGSAFTADSTVVTCTATDAAGNSDSKSFRVNLTTTEEQRAPDIVREATSANGATVTFDFTGCTPDSGSVFPIGATTVTCPETSFTVRVVDTKAPTIGPHDDMTAEATSASGATVIYTAPSTNDTVDGIQEAVCTPASGTTFALGNTTVSCEATDARGNRATPTTFRITVVDTSGPMIDAQDITAPATSASGASVTYTVVSRDMVDGTGTATCSPSSGSVFPLGKSTVTCNAKDSRGNPATPTTFTVEVSDATAPTVTITLDPATPNGMDGWYTSSVTATISATDNGAGVNASTIAHSFDGVTWTPGTTIASLPQGQTTIFARASDNAGNTATTTRRAKIDSTAPAAPPLAPLVAEATSGAGAIVSYAAPAWSDATSGVSTGATCSPASGSLFAIGTASVLCTARDIAGNAGSATLDVSVVDTSAPTVAIVLDPATPLGIDGWYTSAVNATIVANDSATGLNASSLAYSLDGANWTSGSSLVGLPQGQTTIQARASDNAGNTATTSRLVKLDTIAPNVTSTFAFLEGRIARIFFNFSEPMDRNATQAALVGAASWNLSWTDNSTQLALITTLPSYGTFTIGIGPNATDAHGVPLDAAASKSIAHPEPPAPPSAPDAPIALAATVTEGRVRLGWSAPENDHGAPVTSYRVAINGGAPITLTGTYYDVPALPRGAVHTFSVTAINSAGESPAATIAVALPPRSTLAAPSADARGWHQSAPTLAFGVDPADATVHYDVGRGDTIYDGPFQLADGRALLRWYASAGGVDEDAREALFQVDATPPSIVGASATGGETLTIRASVSDATSGIVAVHAIVTPAGGDPLLVALWPTGGNLYEASAGVPPGDYAVAIVAHDAAGHESQASAGSAIVVAPVVPVSPPSPSQVFFPTSGDDFPLESTSIVGDDPGATEPTTDPAEEPAPPEPTFVIEGIDAGARGVIVIRLSGVDNVERVRFVLVDQDGFESELATGVPDLAWDTTTVGDGYYTLEARRGREPADPGQLSIQSSHEVTIVSARVLVRNEYAPPVAAAGAVVGAVLVSAATQTALSAAAGGATSSIGSAAGGFDPFGFAQEVAIDAGQDKLRNKTRERDRRRRIRSLVAGGVSLVILAPLWAFSETEGWSLTAWIPLVPIIGAAAVVVILLKYAAESALAHATGARPRVRLWLAGILSLVVSSILFRNPFGYPAYVDETDESESRSTWRMQGLRGLATIAGAAAFMLPFLALSSVLPWSFIGVGLLLAATNVATAAIPFGPLPGRDIWRWNKWIAIGVALAGFALYVGFAAAYAPLWSLWLVALGGGAAYAFALVRFRQTLRAKTVRVPVQVPVPLSAEGAPGPEGVAVTITSATVAPEDHAPTKGRTRPPRKKGRRHR